MATYQVLDALGDATRRDILTLLRDGPLTVGELATRLPVSRPAVSQHLRVLQACALVTRESLGTRNYYRVDPRGLAALRQWLDDFWAPVLENFASYVEKDLP